MTITTGGTCCPIARIKCAAKHLLALTLALTPVATIAQNAQDLFRGTWQVQTPEDGALVIILKNQGLASYFWGDTTDRKVYQGSWTHSDTLASISWNDGASHLIERTDSGFSATYRNTSGERRYQATASQLPQEMLGQWAKPPTRADEMRSDRDKAKGYFGIWKLADSEEVLFVEPDRSAATNLGKDRGQRGEWAKQGSELHIIWDSGHYGILRETERGYNYKQVEPGQIIEDDETKPVAAARTIESNVSSAWLDNYKAERKKDSGGLAFSSRKVAREFYRGDWLVRREKKNFERVELARFGGLKTSRDRSLGGQWTLSGQDIFMRWDDGMRKVLSPVGSGFVLYAYKPGRPLDGVPTRIYPATPADTGKLAEHLKGRTHVAEQMRQMAEAAGIDPNTQEEAGWGRTFARWAWPFGDEDGDMTTQEMLAKEFEADEASDPWWWPFWSETPAEASDDAEEPAENETPPVNTETATTVPVEINPTKTSEQNGAAEATTSENEKETRAPAIPKRRTTKDWLWPF